MPESAPETGERAKRRAAVSPLMLQSLSSSWNVVKLLKNLRLESGGGLTRVCWGFV